MSCRRWCRTWGEPSSGPLSATRLGHFVQQTPIQAPVPFYKERSEGEAGVGGPEGALTARWLRRRRRAGWFPLGVSVESEGLGEGQWQNA